MFKPQNGYQFGIAKVSKMDIQATIQIPKPHIRYPSPHCIKATGLISKPQVRFQSPRSNTKAPGPISKPQVQYQSHKANTQAPIVPKPQKYQSLVPKPSSPTGNNLGKIKIKVFILSSIHNKNFHIKNFKKTS